MKTNLSKYLCGLLLPCAVATATAQSTWNFSISDAGNGNSLVTWNVSGSLTTSPGAELLEAPLRGITLGAPGLYVNSYTANGFAQSIPTPDGSYFSDPFFGDIPITGYYTYSAGGGSGNDAFGLLVPTTSDTRLGDPILYNPGTQSVIIPVDYSDFNPGTYQSEYSTFATPLTVNLTVGPVPEPSTLALAMTMSAILGAGLMRKRGNRGQDAKRVK